MEGVLGTRVGYAGGTQKNPTYQSIKDHSEAIQIEYDPSVLSYEDLIQEFWKGHAPNQRSYSRQYMSLVLYSTEEEKQIATRTKEQLTKDTGDFIYTEIQELGQFYSAEGYHQKYYLQSRTRLYQQILGLYPDFESFVDSKTAARLNGYIGGSGNREEFEKDLEAMELSETAEQLSRDATRFR